VGNIDAFLRCQSLERWYWHYGMQDLQGAVHLCSAWTVSNDLLNNQHTRSNTEQCLYPSGSRLGHSHQPHEHSPRPTFPSGPSRRQKDQRYPHERSLHRRRLPVKLTRRSHTLSREPTTHRNWRRFRNSQHWIAKDESWLLDS
jgi:hypothetical protein